MAAAKKGMDRHRAQRQPTVMRAFTTIAGETRLAASRIAPTLAQVTPLVSRRDLGRLRRALLTWYDQHHRELPWRETRDPYRIWLSEIMLQQTRVAAVLDHYRIFLARFPNVHALAAASADAVLAAWSGLGYYRRARMLHQCAQQVVEQYGGCFPRDSAALLALPGIGRYTAAAIASIAFAEPVAVVDGNVERVLQRLIGINLTAPQTWQHAQALLDESRPGDFNQAVMELGATVCLPREPRCRTCPVRTCCVAQGEAPRAKSSSRQQKKEIWCALDWNDGNGRGRGKIRLVRRPKESALMPGMWELPQTEVPPRPLPLAAPWHTLRHSITVTNYTVHVLRNTTGQIVWGQGSAPSKRGVAPLPHKAARGKWIAIDRIEQIPITGLTRKILKAGGII
jgi:A/G-specific adenine glycosylase